MLLANNGGHAERVFIEDVFQTFLSTGTGTSRTVTGPDMTKGGLSITKSRSATTGWRFVDTERGPGLSLESNSNAAQSTEVNGVTAFTIDGTSIGSDLDYNTSSSTYVDFLFQKRPKFLDIVTYTGDGTTNRSILHSLGGTVGCIIVKRLDSIDQWWVWHRSATEGTVGVLNLTDAFFSDTIFGANATQTSLSFRTGTSTTINVNGGTYVAYLFAHDAGGFGDSGAENVISCGSFTGNGGATEATALAVTLGFEPQFLIIKAAEATGGNMNWSMLDNMRGYGGSGSSGNKVLYANMSAAEEANDLYGCTTATGFKVWGSNVNVNAKKYIYLAIRRPNKPPTSGTEVYNANAYTGNGAATRVITAGFPADMAYLSYRAIVDSGTHKLTDRLRGLGQELNTTSSREDTLRAADYSTWGQDGIVVTSNEWNKLSGTPSYIAHFFRRAVGVVDIVCYTGTGSAKTEAHNLGAVPELMLVKNRSDNSINGAGTGRDWAVYAGDATDYLVLHRTDATVDNVSWWNDTAPTSSVFTVGTSNSTNESGDTFVAYLFATLPGVSKVFSYTGNGSSQTIDCGFTTGARFVLIKRTDSTGDWYLWDSARGIVAGNDPHLSLNTTAAEITTNDSIDPDTTGFIVNQDAATNINVSSATYIFLAIA